jgi:acetyltransferase
MTVHVEGSLPYMRQVRLADFDGVRDFLAGLSLDTAYRRFFMPMSRPPAQVVQKFVAVDGDERDTWVATMDRAGIVAVASLARVGTGEQAEIAVVVADAWQGRGIGPALLRRMVNAAESRGITRITALALSENRRVARMIRKLWPGARSSYGDDATTTEYVMPVRPAPAGVLALRRGPDWDRVVAAGAARCC